MICATEERTALYRFYDAHENLLYVGISNDPWRRWREHVSTAPWYSHVKHQSVTWYDTEDQARNAETRAIRSERPRFNIAGAVRPPEARLRLTFGSVMGICVTWLEVAGLLNVAIIVAAVLAPPHSLIGTCVHALAWGIVGLDLSLPIPMLAGLLVACAPWIYRFGHWLDLNFGDKPQEREVPQQ